MIEANLMTFNSRIFYVHSPAKLATWKRNTSVLEYSLPIPTLSVRRKFVTDSAVCLSLTPRPPRASATWSGLHQPKPKPNKRRGRGSIIHHHHPMPIHAIQPSAIPILFNSTSLPPSPAFYSPHPHGGRY